MRQFPPLLLERLLDVQTDEAHQTGEVRGGLTCVHSEGSVDGRDGGGGEEREEEEEAGVCQHDRSGVITAR